MVRIRLTLLFLTVSAIARAQAPDLSPLDRAFAEEMERTSTPGAVVTIVRGDRVIYEKAFGVASLETRQPVTPEMLFRIGSTTKMLTAAAVARAASEEKLQLDQPIARYVKGLHPKVGALTTHQLLSHTSGLAEQPLPMGSLDESALERLARSWTEKDFFAPPGAIYSYNGPGYWLAGLVLQEASGKPYADAMEALLFRPLGMERSTLRPLTAVTYPFSQGHAAAGTEVKVVRPMPEAPAMWPAGSVFSNARELARFAIAFLNEGKIEGRQAIPAPAIQLLSQPQARIPGDDEVRYTYGLVSFEYRGVKFLEHGGARTGYGSLISMAPAHKVAVIVLTNKTGIGLRGAAEKALEVLFPLSPKPVEPSRAALPMTAAERRSFTGTYVNGTHAWKVTDRDGKLWIQYGETPRQELLRMGERRFAQGTPDGSEVIFVPGPDGRAGYLHIDLLSARRLP